jgi:protein-disulfide isomerase
MNGEVTEMKFGHSVGTLLVAAILPIAAIANGLDEARIKELVLESIRENPEIVMEAIAILEQRQAEAQADAQSKVLSSQRNVLERDPNAPILGNPDGDVTVVEFFDYNCPYCKRAMSEVKNLIDGDTGVRLVFREWPILGEGSVFAAKAALAARNQGKYEEFHWAMMSAKGQAAEASVLRVAKEVGLDIDRLRRDMETPEVDEHIATSMRLTQSLGFNGTPSFVIGDALVPGFVEQSKLEEFVSAAREAAE